MKNNIDKLIDDTLSLGFGLVGFSRERISRTLDEIRDYGESEKDRIVDSLMEKGQEQREEIRKIVREEIKTYMDLDSYVKKDDLREIIDEEIRKSQENLD
ncbi:MAG: hypothetical protein Q4D88_04705 [Anaerococcus sp.]|nr:hypothetical protein [Anaerococcus sp.]